MATVDQHIATLRRRYLVYRIFEIIMISIAIFLIILGLGKLYFTTAISVITGTLCAVLYFSVQSARLNLFNLSNKRLTAYLNNTYNVFEDSADLLIQDETTLTLLQRLQREKIGQVFNETYPTLKVPHHLIRSASIFFTAIILFVVFSSFKKEIRQITIPDQISTIRAGEVTKPIPAAISEISIQITPPSYTGINQIKTSNPDLEFIEGSTVKWKIKFTRNVTDNWFIFARDSVKITSENFQKTFSRSTFYQIAWKEGTVIRTSDFYKIEVVTDKPPHIVVGNLAQFTEYTINDKLHFKVNANIADDFGVTDSYIIATVSKGSGESVKFRESKLTFDQPQTIRGKNINAFTGIDLMKLGLDPGDELYFYIEALDNKSPKPNRSRTETYFVHLQDTVQEEISMEGGLGVDLMPEYFRSQRQIIIDSEKLLRERKSISVQEFKSRSNELGYDQKVLRLKYGEFLGEEFESGIGPASAIPVEEHDHEEGDDDEEEDVTKQFGHEHDKDNEHNLVPEKKLENHKHEAEQIDGEEKAENPIDAFKHQHDNTEEATFFTQSIRAKLKAALTVMWDAELHLRLFDPEKSLPYQYQALKLLKEISNDSRVYVHKTGFDPPPLKEEKRLTADLSEIKRDGRSNSDQSRKEMYPSMRKALAVTEKLIVSGKQLTAMEEQILLAAGNELSSLAIKEPGRYLKSLSLIKTITEEKDLSDDDRKKSLIVLRNTFWNAVSNHVVLPSGSRTSQTDLDRAFIDKLEKLNHD
jgi:hypothetical protein